MLCAPLENGGLPLTPERCPVSSGTLSEMNRNPHFEVFEPVGLLPGFSRHIPDKGVQMIRYYRLYSNKMRGCRSRANPLASVTRMFDGLMSRWMIPSINLPGEAP